MNDDDNHEGMQCIHVMIISIPSHTLQTQSCSSSSSVLPKVIEIDVPKGIIIQPNPYGYGLFASEAFEKGDILYMTSCLIVPDVLGKNE